MPNKNYFKTKEEARKWYQKYREANRERLREYNKKYNQWYRSKNGYKNEKEWQSNNKIKVNAERLLQYYVNQGKIKRGNCKVCGKPHAQAHHENYNKPLEVVWLCPVHHKAKHKKLSTRDQNKLLTKNCKRV